MEEQNPFFGGILALGTKLQGNRQCRSAFYQLCILSLCFLDRFCPVDVLPPLPLSAGRLPFMENNLAGIRLCVS